MSGGLAGQVALVVGGSHAPALADALAGEGCAVVRGVPSNASAGPTAARDVEVDMTSVASREGMIAEVLRRHGRIDLLVTMPGSVTPPDASWLDIDPVAASPRQCAESGCPAGQSPRT